MATNRDRKRVEPEAGLTALMDTARDLTLPYDLDTLLEVICRRARVLLGLDLVYVVFRAEDGADAYVRAWDGVSGTLRIGLRLHWDGDPAGTVAQTGAAPPWTADYAADSLVAHAPELDAVVRAEGLRAAIGVPLGSGESPVGVLCGANRAPREFTQGEITLMRSLGNLAAVAVERARGARSRDALTASRRQAALQTRLTGLLLDGAAPEALAEAAADELGGSLRLLDPEGQVLAAAHPAAAARPDQDGWVAADPERPAPSGPDPAELDRAALAAHANGTPVALRSGGCVAPVRAGGQALGVLVQHPAVPGAAPLLQIAARSMAVLLMPRHGAVAVQGPVGDELLEDLIAEPQRQPPHHVAERGRALAMDLYQEHVVVVARPEGGPQGRAVVWASSYANRTQGLKAVDGGLITLLLPGTDPDAAARAVSEELAQVLGHPVTAGAAGPVTDPGALPGTYREAVRCLDAVTALGGEGTTASARDLGFLGVLLSENQDVDGFISSALGPVIDVDRQRLTDLVGTLEAHFDAGGSRTYAAEALHVHPNTVSRRLDRITELLGPDWQKPSSALEIQLALRLLRTRSILRSGHLDPAATPNEPATRA